MATDYLYVLRDQALLQVNNASVATLRSELSGAKAKRGNGDFTRTDVALAQAKYLGGIANADAAESALHGSLANYTRSVGHAPGTLVVPEVGNYNKPSSLQEAENEVMRRNPDVVAAKRAEDAARYAIDAARGQLRPAIRLNVQASLDDNALIRTPEVNNPKRLEDIAAYLEVDIPIYDGGAGTAHVSIARHAYAQAVAQREDTELGALETLRGAWAAEEQAADRVKALGATVTSDNEVVEGTQSGLNVGSKTLFDLLTAQDQLATDKSSLIRAEADVLVDRFSRRVGDGRPDGRLFRS